MKQHINKILFSAVFIFYLSVFSAEAEEFVFKHQEGDKYRILSTVTEDVYIDFKLNHKAEILNRITVDVISVTDGKGYHKTNFQTSERAVNTGQASEPGKSYQWAREYESEFERDKLGRITIDKKYFMPVVRNVPVFPDREIKVGEKWTYEGHEVHDFRDNFGIKDPYYIPFNADYIFLGNRTWKGNIYPAFSVSYRVQFKPQAVPGKIWPRKISGSSEQIVYWDFYLGQPAAYEEEFRYVFEFSNGRTVEYRGKAEAEILEAERMDKENLAEEILEELQRLDISDVTVRVVDEGITISLDDLQFRADTAILLPGEKEKLDKIVEILLRYQERDILVSGHTALAGTEEGRKKLSADRASVIADYIISKNARTPDRVIVRGYGAQKPVASNNTEEGKRKNRRVEITLLEN